jgi:FtsH-binding integral membrane protein
LRMVLDWSSLNHIHPVFLLSDQSQFLETWKFFIHHVFILSITFINFIWEWFSTEAHWMTCISVFCSQINHNSSKLGNSLFIMFLVLWITFISFIWEWLSIEVHWIRCIPFLCSQINHNSSKLGNFLFITFFILLITFIRVKLAVADRVNCRHWNKSSLRFASGECCVHCWRCISTLM